MARLKGALKHYGSAVKAAGIVDVKGILDSYGVVFDASGNPEARDLNGQYFSAKNYLGRRGRRHLSS